MSHDKGGLLGLAIINLIKHSNKCVECTVAASITHHSADAFLRLETEK